MAYTITTDARLEMFLPTEVQVTPVVSQITSPMSTGIHSARVITR